MLNNLHFYVVMSGVLLLTIEYFIDLKTKNKRYKTDGVINNLLCFIGLEYFRVIISKITIPAIVYLSLNGFTSFTYNFGFTHLLLSFIFLDFIYYLLHLLKHKYSILWMMHHVHHSDEQFNVSTNFRASWLELLYTSSMPAMIAIFIGISFKEFASIALFMAFYQHLVHSAYIRFPSWMNYILVTPQSHASHHDTNTQMGNYGVVLSIWDNIFKTKRNPIHKRDTSFIPGIKGFTDTNFINAQIYPILEYLRKIRLLKKN